MLDRLIYMSTAAADLAMADITRIVARSQMRNRQLDVTGMLLFDHPGFVQVLEGRADVVDALFADISRDARHHGVRVVDRRGVAQRRFERWSMELLVTQTLADQVAQLPAAAGGDEAGFAAQLDGLIDAMLAETGFV